MQCKPLDFYFCYQFLNPAPPGSPGEAACPPPAPSCWGCGWLGHVPWLWPLCPAPLWQVLVLRGCAAQRRFVSQPPRHTWLSLLASVCPAALPSGSSAEFFQVFQGKGCCQPVLDPSSRKPTLGLGAPVPWPWGLRKHSCFQGAIIPCPAAAPKQHFYLLILILSSQGIRNHSGQWQPGSCWCSS